MKPIENIYRSILMATLCAFIVMGSQIVNRIQHSHVAHRDHGYWAAAGHSLLGPIEMIVPEKCTIVSVEYFEIQSDVIDTMIQHINDNRSCDVSFAIIASVLFQCLISGIG